MPGLPLGFTSDGPRLYGPAPVCSNCRAIDNSPAALLTCARSGRTVHPRCLEQPVDAEAARRSSSWIENARCDGCGAASANQLTGHWSKKAAADLQTSWQPDAGRRLLCFGCSSSLKAGGRCSTTLTCFKPTSTGLQCPDCSLWAALPPDHPQRAEGRPMPPPPPASVGGPSSSRKLPPLEKCEHCAAQRLHWELKVSKEDGGDDDDDDDDDDHDHDDGDNNNNK